MYSVDDFVIYRNEGVCKIADITVREFRNRNTEYYVLKPVHNDNAEIFVPKNNETLVAKMRKVLSKKEIIEIINQMPDEKLIWIDDEDLRKEEYRKILDVGNRTELVKLIKTLYLHRQNQRKNGKKFHISDERFLKDAEHMLYDEFAFVLNLSENEVIPFIMGQIEK